MTKTLLAVDDSATMRKVLEITFSGEDFKVVTAEGPEAALNKLSARPDVCVIDTTLGTDDGYALSREIRKRDPKAVIVMLASRHTPYDKDKGKDCGADDFMDKPFDTQQLIDKVKKAILTRSSGHFVAAAPAQNGTAVHAPIAPVPQVAVAAPVAAHTAAKASAATPLIAAVTPTVVAAQNLQNDVSPKLDALGLTAQQQQAVLAISRELVERVVWEVVPQLAEVLIKEEIQRLMR